MVTDSRKTLAASSESYKRMLSTKGFALRVIDGPHKGLSLTLESDLVRIGRTEWCDLTLPDDHWVSGIHCECWLDEDGVRIRDLGSRNGIVVGDCRVMDAYLAPGASMLIGNSLIQLAQSEERREIEISYKDASGLLVGQSRAMRKIFTMLSRLANRNVPLLLTGETGTGKTSIAKALHMQCPTPEAPFVVVNCGALPSGLIEAALFGYEKGAFTGAAQRHQGFFQQAHGGTLFLDEIGELPLELQPKLLDVLERKCIRRLGSEREEPVSFRLISATHKNLPKAIADGTFREDLFFRISVVDLEVPPLRERREDILLLAKAFLKSLAPNENILLGEDAIDSLQNHIWPGNIRQLRNALEKTVTFLDYPVIDKEALFIPSVGGEGTNDARTSRGSRPTHPRGGGQSSVEDSFLGEVLPSFPLGASQEPVNLKDVLAATERILIEQALDETDRNVQEAAHLLSISPAWLYNRIKKYGLSNKK